MSYGLTDLQKSIMYCISDWSKQSREPIAKRYVLDTVVAAGASEPTALHSLKILIKRGYIRLTRDRSHYIQLGSIQRPL